MNITTRDDACRMRDVIFTLHSEIEKLLNEYGKIPLPKSQAHLELDTYSRQESVETVLTQGNTLIEVAADQLMAFCKTITEPIQTISPWTCVRSLLESSALAAWLLDPSAKIDTRIQRSFSFRLEGLKQQLKYLIAIEAQTDEIYARIVEVEGVALGIGCPQMLDKKGRRTGATQKMPSVTEIIKISLNEEADYRMLSAIAHGHLWAIQQLSFSPVKNEDDKTGTFEKNLEPDSASYLCLKAVRVFARPVWYKSQLFGFDSKRLAEIFDSAFDNLGVNEDNCRFWKAE